MGIFTKWIDLPQTRSNKACNIKRAPECVEEEADIGGKIKNNLFLFHLLPPFAFSMYSGAHLTLQALLDPVSGSIHLARIP